LHLLAQQRPLPTISVVRDAQRDVTLDTPAGSQRLPFATVVSIPFDQDGIFRFSTEQKHLVTVAARDLVASDTWHVVQDVRGDALALWAATGHVATVPPTATVVEAEAAAC
jgi:hypothetical protein